jgi:hypothetical protein
VVLILSFGKHAGSDCECCNLAHRVRLHSYFPASNELYS